MKVEQTPIRDLVVLTPKRFGDSRGFFCESWSAKKMADAGFDMNFVQDNHSLSEKVGTVRGLHFQAPPTAQDKLVRCGRGRLFDVAVDIRRGSPTYGKWFGVELSFENGKQLLVPKGFLHGFVTREPNTEIIYKCTDLYDPSTEGAVRFNDPDIGIDWGIAAADAHLSEKDAAAGSLADLESPFKYDEVV